MFNSADTTHNSFSPIVVLLAVVASQAMLATAGHAQAATAPAFEVATIKPSNTDLPGMGISIQGHQFSTHKTTLNFLIKFAYRLNARQVVGGPAWLDTEEYDIVAKPEGESSLTMSQLRPMVQRLLEDRFKLTFHREQRKLPVYALVVGKNGARLKKSEADPAGLPGVQVQGASALTISATNNTMLGLAAVLQMSFVDRPMVDHTGLAGKYDFTLRFTPDLATPSGSLTNDPNAPPDLFTAIQEQLGLKLEAVQAPAEVLVVDHIERPSEN
jgi:uncharacterized protein (TIGR03435 family)